MKTKIKSLILAVIFILTSLTSITKAQEELQKVDENAPITEFLSKPENIKNIMVSTQEAVLRVEKSSNDNSGLQIKNTRIVSSNEEGIKISLDVYNEKYIQPGLRYAIEFSEIGENGQSIVVDRKVYEEEFTIKEKETIHKNIEYNFPIIFNSTFTYAVNVFIGNGSTILVGKNVDTLKFAFSSNKDQAILSNTIGDANIKIGSCIIKKDSDPKEYPISQRTVVSYQKKNKIICDADGGDKMTELESSVEVYKNSIFGRKIELNSQLNKQWLKAGKQGIEFIFTDGLSPGAYEGVVTFKNVNIKPVFFSFFMDGFSAVIENIKLVEDNYSKEDTARIFTRWSISRQGDFYVNNENNQNWQGALDISIKDQKGEECGNLRQEVDSPVGEITEAKIPIFRQCLGVVADVSLMDNEGNILDRVMVKTGGGNSWEKEYPDRKIKTTRRSFIIIFILTIFVISLVIILIKYIKNKNIFKILIGLLVISGTFLISNKAVAFSQVSPSWQHFDPIFVGDFVTFGASKDKSVYRSGEAIVINASMSHGGGGSIIGSALYLQTSWNNSLYQVLGDSYFGTVGGWNRTAELGNYFPYCNQWAAREGCATSTSMSLQSPSTPGEYSIRFISCTVNSFPQIVNCQDAPVKYSFTIGDPLPAPTMPIITGPNSVNLNATVGFNVSGSIYTGEWLVYDLQVSNPNITYRTIPLLASNLPSWKYNLSFIGYNVGDVVQLTARACDKSGTTCSAWTAPFPVTVAASMTVPTITGPTEVSVNTSQKFIVSGSTHSGGGEIYYKVKDNLDGIKRCSYTRNSIYRYPNLPASPPPSYEFSWSFLSSRDACDFGFNPGDAAQLFAQACTTSGVCSAWSAPFNIKISPNRPPSYALLTGPTSGYVGTPYTYTADDSVDPDGDRIYHKIEFKHLQKTQACQDAFSAAPRPLKESDSLAYYNCRLAAIVQETTDLFYSPKSINFQKTFTEAGTYSAAVYAIDDPWGANLGYSCQAGGCSRNLIQTITISNSASFSGMCGSDNGLILSSAPTKLCSLGTAEPAIPLISGNSWSWVCRGTDNTVSTDDVVCSAQQTCINGVNFSYVCPKVAQNCAEQPCGSQVEIVATCYKKDDCSGVMTSTNQTDCGSGCVDSVMNCPACPSNKNWKEIAP